MGRVQQQAFLCGMAAIYLFALASLYTQIQACDPRIGENLPNCR